MPAPVFCDERESLPTLAVEAAGSCAVHETGPVSLAANWLRAASGVLICAAAPERAPKPELVQVTSLDPSEPLPVEEVLVVLLVADVVCGGSVTVIVLDAELTASPLVVLFAVTVSVFTGCPVPV
jgi:hypothetical protein